MSEPTDPTDADAVALAHRLLDLARAGGTDELIAYVDAGVPVNLTDPAGNTVLMLAAYHGHAQTVQALIERGADVDRVNDRGQSPLAGAVFKAEIDVVRALISAGANPNAGSPSAIDTARFFARDDVVALLAAPG